MRNTASWGKISLLLTTTPPTERLPWAGLSAATPGGAAVSEYDVFGSLYTVSGVRPLQHGRTSLVIVCYP